MRLDLNTGLYEKMIMSHMTGVSRRIYATGFIIGKYIFAIGGLSMNGNCLNDILQLDIQQKMCRTITKETNKTVRHLKPMCSSACVAAFYSSRYDDKGINLTIDRVSQDIDWSTALSLIKYEGIYHFGGRDEKNVASNRLLCF